MKNNVNVPLKSNKKKTFFKIQFFVKVLKVNDETSRDPDPLFRCMDPRIRIRTKMSWIRNTGFLENDFDLNAGPFGPHT
jgi:hypothetical protein